VIQNKSKQNHSAEGTRAAAQHLGRLGKGKPKTITDAERRRRAEALSKVREKRWRHGNKPTKETEMNQE